MNLVREAEGEDRHLTGNLDTVTHADKFLTDCVALRNADHHVMDESAVETVHRAVTRKICRACQFYFISLYGDGDVRINLLAELSERSFNLNHVSGGNLYGHAGRKVYRQFTNS